MARNIPRSAQKKRIEEKKKKINTVVGKGEKREHNDYETKLEIQKKIEPAPPKKIIIITEN